MAPEIDTHTLLRLAIELQRLIYGPLWQPPNPEALAMPIHVPTVAAVVEDLCAAAAVFDFERDATGDLFAQGLRAHRTEAIEIDAAPGFLLLDRANR